MSNKNGFLVGIDLGSTMSEICGVEGNQPTIVTTAEGSRTFPSVVGIDDKGERTIGVAAKRKQLMYPDGTIYLIKRLIGRTWEEAQDAIKHLNYKVVNHNGYPYVEINGKEYSPQEICSWIIADMKKRAEEYFGVEVTGCVITVPALFDDAQRHATQEAAELAGLKVARIINEPTAAAVASRLEKSGDYAVVDFGGSTTDVTLLELDADGDEQVFNVLSSYGDTWLGGADLDNAVAKWIVDEFNKIEKVDVSKDKMAMQRIVEAAEKAKIELSGVAETEINLPYLTAVDGMPKHFVKTLSRAQFENLIRPYIDKVIACANEAIKLAKEKKSDLKLEGIILVGGSCRVPMLQDMLSDAFKVELIRRADLDLAVAQGAAIQANVLSGNDNSILLVDVIPISVGIEVMGTTMEKMIEANKTIPTRTTKMFSTAVDNQTQVEIKVLQGERPMSADNKEIGKFFLDGIAPAPRGIPQIEVTFEMDANGILNVKAIDKATNKEKQITIERGNSLTPEEIERIKKDAADHAEEDNKKRAELDMINSTQGYLFAVENSLKDENIAAKITDDEKKQLGDLCTELKSSLDSNPKDLTKIEEQYKNLSNVWDPIITRINKPADEGASQDTPNPFPEAFGSGFPGDNGKPSNDGEDVVNAEEVK